MQVFWKSRTSTLQTLDNSLKKIKLYIYNNSLFSVSRAEVITEPKWTPGGVYIFCRSQNDDKTLDLELE